MTDTSTLTAHEVVQSIFQELAGDRISRLLAEFITRKPQRPWARRWRRGGRSDTANAIAFHLTDWNAEAAFIVALHLFPERFTAEQIREGADSLLIHAPNHMAAAAHLAG
jgi:hypothetical protein